MQRISPIIESLTKKKGHKKNRKSQGKATPYCGKIPVESLAMEKMKSVYLDSRERPIKRRKPFLKSKLTLLLCFLPSLGFHPHVLRSTGVASDVPPATEAFVLKNFLTFPTKLKRCNGCQNGDLNTCEKFGQLCKINRKIASTSIFTCPVSFRPLEQFVCLTVLFF